MCGGEQGRRRRERGVHRGGKRSAEISGGSKLCMGQRRGGGEAVREEEGVVGGGGGGDAVRGEVERWNLCQCGE